MSDDKASDQNENPSDDQDLPPPEPMRIVPADDFDQVDFEKPIVGILEVECHVLETAYRKALLGKSRKQVSTSFFRRSAAYTSN